MSKLTQSREKPPEQESSKASPRKLLQQTRDASPEGAVDQWMKDQLQQVYDDVVLEPVPQDFLNLLKKIDQNNR